MNSSQPRRTLIKQLSNTSKSESTTPSETTGKRENDGMDIRSSTGISGFEFPCTKSSTSLENQPNKKEKEQHERMEQLRARSKDLEMKGSELLFQSELAYYVGENVNRKRDNFDSLNRYDLYIVHRCASLGLFRKSIPRKIREALDAVQRGSTLDSLYAKLLEMIAVDEVNWIAIQLLPRVLSFEQDTVRARRIYSWLQIKPSENQMHTCDIEIEPESSIGYRFQEPKICVSETAYAFTNMIETVMIDCSEYMGHDVRDMIIASTSLNQTGNFTIEYFSTLAWCFYLARCKNIADGYVTCLLSKRFNSVTSDDIRSLNKLINTCCVQRTSLFESQRTPLSDPIISSQLFQKACHLINEYFERKFPMLDQINLCCSLANILDTNKGAVENLLKSEDDVPSLCTCMYMISQFIVHLLTQPVLNDSNEVPQLKNSCEDRLFGAATRLLAQMLRLLSKNFDVTVIACELACIATALQQRTTANQQSVANQDINSKNMQFQKVLKTLSQVVGSFLHEPLRLTATL